MTTPTNGHTNGKNTPRVRVIALVHDLDQGNYLLDLQFRSIDGGNGIVRIPRALIKSPGEIVGQLLDAGAVLPDEQKEAVQLVQTAARKKPKSRYAITRRSGWHGSSFVTRNGTIGEDQDAIRYAGGTNVDPGFGLCAGAFDEWRAGLEEPCKASTFLTLSLGLAYGGPILDLLGEDEGAIFNFHATSSNGKSLAARALSSIAGRAKKSDLATYDITDRGVEELCHAHNDGTVGFDEEGRSKGGKGQRRERVRSIAFMVPSGRGMIRSEKVARTSDLANHTWRVLAMSSGEKPLEDAATPRAAGEQLRHIDIKVPHPRSGGIFDRLAAKSREDKLREAARLAGQVEATIGTNFGVGLEPYLAALVAHRPYLVDAVREIVAEIVTSVGADGDPWERRFATKFAIIGAGAILAAEFGVAPFDAAHARRCVRKAYRVARRSVFSVEEAADDLCTRLEGKANDGSRFPCVERGGRLPSNLQGTAWGFRRTKGQGDVIAVDPARFKKLAGSQPLADAILGVLIAKGIAVRGSDGKSHPQIAVQGFNRPGRSRWVCLRVSAL